MTAPTPKVQPGQQANLLPEEVAEPIEVVEPVYFREMYAFDPVFKGYLIVEEGSDIYGDDFLPNNFPEHIWENDYLGIQKEVGSFEKLDQYLSTLQVDSPKEYESACLEIECCVHGIGPKYLQHMTVFQNYAIWKEARALELSIDKPAFIQRPKRTHKL